VSAVPSIGRASRVDRPVAPGADAASELYERFSAQIFGYCFHQLGSREEAEDAVQTTFMNAFRGLARGIVPDAEQAWIFKIAHNVCLSRRRSSWRRGRVEAPNNMEVLQEVVPAKDKVADELIRLQDVLETMPENQRRAILLREWQGLSYREIAHELELSQAAVETLIFRARRALAAGLEDSPDQHTWRKRLRRGADVGGAVAFVKTLLGGGGAAAVKVATVVALAGATVVTTAADRMHPRQGDPRAKSSAAAVPLRATTDSTGSSAGTASSAVTFRHDAAPRALRTPAPHAAAPSSPATGSAPAAQAPTSASESQPAPASARQEPTAAPDVAAPQARAPKSQGHHGRPPDPGPPAAASEGNQGNGHGKGRPKDPPADPSAPPAQAGTEAPPASDDSAGHRSDAAPGQNKPDDPSSHGNGRGK
jgi:RNA polymerase sigma factor (sigma-70 family)